MEEAVAFFCFNIGDMSEIESVFETYRRAVLHKDVEAFTFLFDDNVRIFDMWHWAYSGLPSWRCMAEEWFGSLKSETVVVTFSDIQITATADMACATAFVKFAALSAAGEELRHLHNRLTWVAQNKNGTWKIIHEHTSGPVDTKTMKVVLIR